MTTPLTADAPSERAILAEIAAIDAALSKQLTAILHHPEFRKLEASWRGLHHLVRNTETSDFLKIRVLNASQTELDDDFERAPAPEESQLSRLVTTELALPAGEPFSLLVGDLEFSHRPEDLNLLGHLAMVAGDANCPFIAAASPAMFGVETWEDLAARSDLSRPFQSLE